MARVCRFLADALRGEHRQLFRLSWRRKASSTQVLSRTLPLPPSMLPLNLVVYPQSYSASLTLNVATHPCRVSLVVICLSHPQCSHSPLSCILGRTLPLHPQCSYSPLSCILSRTLPLPPSMFPLTLVVYPQSYSASPTLNVPTHPCRLSLVVLCLSHPQCSHSPLSYILSRTLPLPPSMSPLTLVVYPQSYSASLTLNVPTHPCHISLVVLCLSHPQCPHSPLSCILSRTLPLSPSMFPLTLVVYPQSYSASLTLNVPTHPCRVSLVVPPSMFPLTIVVYPQSYSASPTLNVPTHPCRVSLVILCLSHPQCFHSPLSCILSRSLPLSPSMFPLTLVVHPQSCSASTTLNVPTHPCRVSLVVLCLSHPQYPHSPLSCILSRTLPLPPSMFPLTLAVYPQSYSASPTLNVATHHCRVYLVVLCLSHPQCPHSPLSCILSRTLPLPPSMFPLTLVVYPQSYSASHTLNVPTHPCRVSLVVLCLSHPHCSHSPLSCILSRTLPLSPSMFPLTLVMYPHPCRVSVFVLCLSHPQCCHSPLSCILSRTLPLPPSMFPLTLVVYPQSYSASLNVPTHCHHVVLCLSHPHSHSPLSCILSRTLFPLTLVYPQSYSASPTLNVPTDHCVLNPLVYHDLSRQTQIPLSYSFHQFPLCIALLGTYSFFI